MILQQPPPTIKTEDCTNCYGQGTVLVEKGYTPQEAELTGRKTYKCYMPCTYCTGMEFWPFYDHEKFELV